MSKLLNFFLPRKTIAQHLAEACAAIQGLKQRGHNGEFSYLYVLDIANAFRAELHKRGIVVIPNDTECTMFSADTELERGYTEYRVKTEFTVTDGRESLIYSAYGVGRDLDGKALFQAQTGALKSWLKRLGLIFGERDDPEHRTDAPEPEHEPTPQLAGRLKEFQVRAWEAAVRNSSKTASELAEIVSRETGFSVTPEQLVSLPRHQFDTALGIAMKHTDLTEALEKSTQDARRKRKAPANGSGETPQAGRTA